MIINATEGQKSNESFFMTFICNETSCYIISKSKRMSSGKEEVGNGRDRSLPLVDIIEIATPPKRHFAMTNEDCDTVSYAGLR